MGISKQAFVSLSIPMLMKKGLEILTQLLRHPIDKSKTARIQDQNFGECAKFDRSMHCN